MINSENIFNLYNYKNLYLKKLFAIMLLLFISCTLTFAHEGQKKKDTSKTNDQAVHKTDKTKLETDTSLVNNAITKHAKEINKRATFDEFPTLHPLVVHFPITLFLLAAISHLFGFFVFEEQLSYITLILTFSAILGALVAALLVHPHTTALTGSAQWVLLQHEKYAYLTLWAGGASLVLKLISHFIFKRKIWSEGIVFVALAFTAYCINVAGHYGAQLTHIEGVGPQGKYLEMNSHDKPHSH